MFPLTGQIQHYAWGGYRFIPELLQMPSPSETPCAEYWMGVHPKSPSRLRINEDEKALPELIASDPAYWLGASVAARFGTLPFLLKIQDVRDMLSIQVHPTQAEAEEGYSKEVAAGIPEDAPYRNYKDRHHKPEMFLATGDFWLLHGFRSPERLQEIFREVEALAPLQTIFEAGSYQQLYRYVMELPQSGVDAVFAPLAEMILPRYRAGELEKSHPHFWAARALSALPSTREGLDRGLFSIYLFNVVQLRAGQAIFQGAGLPHAYLEGQGVELMANSDNVLRGGLTPKHIDIPELLRLVRYEATYPQVQDGEGSAFGEAHTYRVPAEEFSLMLMRLAGGIETTLRTFSPEIWFVLRGQGGTRGAGGLQDIKTGQAFYVLPGETLTVKAGAEGMEWVRAYVPGFTQPEDNAS